jgi:hypothetical protein
MSGDQFDNERTDREMLRRFDGGSELTDGIARALAEITDDPGTFDQITIEPAAPHDEHTVGGPNDCPRCQLLRDNQHWMEPS